MKTVLLALSALLFTGCVSVSISVQPTSVVPSRAALPSAALSAVTPTPEKITLPMVLSSPALPASPTPAPTPEPSPTPTPDPMRAVRIDFDSVLDSRPEIPELQALVLESGVNTVALGAGRPEWTFFAWAGREEYWSSAVRNTGLDLLAEDIRNFRADGLGVRHIDAVVDVYAPNFIAENPALAAVSYWGAPSDLLVSTAGLLEGPFHDLLLDMIEYIAIHYDVDSISITELAYHDYGYGAADLALYRAYTGRDDWPRLADGTIAHEDPSIGEWRSAAIGQFLAEAAARVRPHGKELIMDVKVSWENLSNEGLEHGHHYPVMLQHADRLVVWAYAELAGYPPEYLSEIAAYLSARPESERFVLSPGMWGEQGELISPEDLGRSVRSAIAGGIKDVWVTPSNLMSAAHWREMAAGW